MHLGGYGPEAVEPPALLLPPNLNVACRPGLPTERPSWGQASAGAGSEEDLRVVVGWG